MICIIYKTIIILQVEMVYLNEGYNGEHGLYANDIAVIVLEKKLSFSNGVVPVCIDWDSIYKVKNEDSGMVNMLYYIIIVPM